MAPQELTPADAAHERLVLPGLVADWRDEWQEAMAAHTSSRVIAVGNWLIDRAEEMGRVGLCMVDLPALALDTGMAITGARRGLRMLDLMGLVALQGEARPDVWVVDQFRLGGLAAALPPPLLVTNGTAVLTYLVQPGGGVVHGAQNVALQSLGGPARRRATVNFADHGWYGVVRADCFRPLPGHLRAPLPPALFSRTDLWVGRPDIIPVTIPERWP